MKVVVCLEIHGIHYANASKIFAKKEIRKKMMTESLFSPLMILLDKLRLQKKCQLIIATCQS